MTEPTADSGNTPAGRGKTPLHYAPGTLGRRQLSPWQYRNVLLWFMGVALAGTVAWWVAMFCTCRPNVGDCVFVFTPLVLGATWVSMGWQLATFVRKYPQPRRWVFRAIIGIAFLLGPYNFFRAGGDMFELSVRFHLWRAGGARKVQTEFNQWVASRPADGHGKQLFGDFPPTTGSYVPIPVTKLPPTVRYMHRHFPSRLDMASDDVADLDNVSVLTTTNILIGPPGWEPQGGADWRDHIFGGRRKVADGIWVMIGVYDK
jgi:hypothetical protein